MSLRIINGITFGEANAIEFEVEEVTGTVTFTVRIDSGGMKWGSTVTNAETRYAHEGMGTVGATLGGYIELAAALKVALEAGSVDGGNSLTYTVVWSTTALGYTFSASGSDIAAIRFSTVSVAAEGTRAAQLLGFSGDDTSGPFASDVVAYYAIAAAMGCKSNPTELYEPPGVVEGGFTMSGTHFAISAIEAIKFDDFDLFFESKPASYKHVATAAVPFTYEHMWEHVRGVEPFTVIDDDDSRVYFLRPDAAVFDPERAVANWDGGFHHQFRCYFAGFLP